MNLRMSKGLRRNFSLIMVVVIIFTSIGYLSVPATIAYADENTSNVTLSSTPTQTAPAEISALAVTATPTPPADRTNVSVIFGSGYKENGIKTWYGDAGSVKIVTKDGRSGTQTDPASGNRYIYCNVDNTYIYGGKNTVKLTIEYFDDAVAENKGFNIAYNSVITPWSYTDKVLLRGSNTWKTATFVFEDAEFANKCNGADFRIETDVAVCFGSVTVEKIKQINVMPSTLKPGNMFMDGEQADIKLNFNNELDIAQNATANYKVTTYYGKVVSSGILNLSLEPKASGVVRTISLGALQKGTYTLTVDLANQDGSIKKHETMPFSFITDISGKTLNDHFGVGAHFAQGKGNIQQLAPVFKQGGITTVRDEYYWAKVELQKNVYTFPASYDEYISKLVEQGLEPLVILNYTNNLHVTGNIDTPEERTAYANYCAAVAAHLKGKVNTFEIWNEWNGGSNTGKTVEGYYELLKAAALAIKAVNSDARIVGGAAYGYDATFLKKLIDLGGCDYFDVISFHPYVDPDSPERGGVVGFFEDINNYVIQKGINKHIEFWATEIGWPTCDTSMGGVPEIVSASYGAQLYTLALANPDIIDRVYWYDFLNDGTNPTQFEENQGLLSLTAGGSPKASFVAFNAISDILSGAVITNSYNTLDPNLSIYKFRRTSDGKDVLVLWAKSGSQSVGLNLGSSQLVISDIFGNQKQYTSENGITSLTATVSPIYIVGESLKDPILATPAFRASTTEISAVPGESISLNIYRSSGAESLSGTYEIELPEGWVLLSGGQFSQGSSADEIKFKVPEGARKTTEQVRIYPRSASGELYGSIVMSTRMLDAFVIKAVPALNANGDGWDITLKLANQNNNAPISGGTVTLVEPAEITKTVVFNTIPAGTETVIRFPAPMLTGDLRTRIKAVITRDDGFSTTIEKDISSLTAVKKDNPITIDGAIDTNEWTNAMQFKLEDASKVKMISNWGGVSDLSLAGWVKWDETYLYIAASVTDNIHDQINDPDNTWKGDGIQLTIDPGRAKGYASIGWSELGFALSSLDGSIMKTTFSSAVEGLEGSNLRDSLCSIVRTGDKTNYEIALKWTDVLPVGMIPADGTDIGFSLLVNEADRTGRRGWMEYMSGIGLNKDPKLYGDLLLTDRKSISVPGVTPPPTQGTTEILPQSQMTATASSFQAGSEPSKAIDGNASTIWHSSWSPRAPMPQSITLNLGGTYKVNGLKYLPRTSGVNGRIVGYNIYVSSDGVNFTKVCSGNWAYDATEKSAKFNPVSASYLKLEAVYGEVNFASAAEIRVTHFVNENKPPVLEEIGPKTVNEGELLTFTVNGADVEGNPLTYTVTGLPEGAAFNPETRIFTWTPGFDKAGEHKVKFSVSDGKLSDEEEVTIVVNNVNRAPVFTTVSQSVYEDTELKFTIGVMDPDGDALTLTASNLPEGASFNAASGEFAWKTDFTDSGEYTVRLEATDGSLSSTENVKITVVNVSALQLAAKLSDYVGNLELNVNKKDLLRKHLGDVTESLGSEKYKLAVVKMKVLIQEIKIFTPENVSGDQFKLILDSSIDILMAIKADAEGKDAGWTKAMLNDIIERLEKFKAQEINDETINSVMQSIDELISNLN